MTQLSTTLLLIAFSMYGFSMFFLFVMVAGTIFILSKHYYVNTLENIPVEEDVFIKEPIADIPVLPCPSAKDLGIDTESKLGKIFTMLIHGDIITNELCFWAVESKKASSFVFKLRKKGLVIDTLTMPDLSVGYKFRKFNYDKTI